MEHTKDTSLLLHMLKNVFCCRVSAVNFCTFLALLEINCVLIKKINILFVVGVEVSNDQNEGVVWVVIHT